MENVLSVLETIPVWVYWIAAAVVVVLVLSVVYSILKRIRGKRIVKRLDHQEDLNAQDALIMDTQHAIDRYLRVRDEVREYSTDLHNMVNYPAFNNPRHTTRVRLATLLDENEAIIEKIEQKIFNAKQHRKLFTPDDRATLRDAATMSDDLQRTFTELRLDSEAIGWVFNDPADAEQIITTNQYIALLDSNHDLSIRRHALYLIHSTMLNMFGAYSLHRNAEIFDEVFYNSLMNGYFTAEEFDDYSEAPPTDVEINSLLDDTPVLVGQIAPQRDTLIHALLRYWRTQNTSLGQTIQQLVDDAGHNLADIDDTTFFQLLTQQEHHSVVHQAQQEAAVHDALRQSLQQHNE